MTWTGLGNIRGPQGSQGAAGSQGVAGSQGSAGTAGSQGANGGVGAQGSAGTAGSQGAQGAAGAQGSPGSQGTAGTAGTQGAQGAAASYTETVNALGTVTSTKTLPALSLGTLMTATLTSATPCTFTMPTAAAGLSFTLALKQPASGTVTTATFTGVVWPAGGAPVITPTLAAWDLLSFVCLDGSTWYGSYVQGY